LSKRETERKDKNIRHRREQTLNGIKLIFFTVQQSANYKNNNKKNNSKRLPPH